MDYFYENQEKNIEIPSLEGEYSDCYITEREIRKLLQEYPDAARTINRIIRMYRGTLIHAMNILNEHHFDLVDLWIDLGKKDARAVECGFQLPEIETKEIDPTLSEKELQELRQEEKKDFLLFGVHHTEEELQNIQESLRLAIDTRKKISRLIPLSYVRCGCEYSVMDEHDRHLDAGQQGQIDAIEILLAESQRSHGSSEQKGE